MSGPGDDFRLPDVGEGLDQAEIVEWLVTEGDTVDRDQPLVEILTDKSQTQLPSPRAGVIKRLGFAEGDMAEVGQVLIEYETATTDLVDPPPPPPTSLQTAAASAPTATLSVSPDGSAAAVKGARRPKASPAVRRRALETGVDLQALTGRFLTKV